MAESGRSRIAALVLSAALLLGTGGCDTLRAALRDDAGSVSTIGDLEPLAAQLSELELLSVGTYKQKVDLFSAIENAYQQDPSDTNRMRYALAKSVIDHPAVDLQAAFSELRALLEGDTSLSLAQEQFAAQALQRIEYEIILETDNNRLQGELSRVRSSDTASSTRADARVEDFRQRLAAAEADNLRLAEELEQARQQLDAIMSIETSSDRTN